jgi:hypothetical protein
VRSLGTIAGRSRRGLCLQKTHDRALPHISVAACPCPDPLGSPDPGRAAV